MPTGSTIEATGHADSGRAFASRRQPDWWKEIAPELLRRNVVVSGINLSALRYMRFRIGTAILEGSGPCPPCSRMEENLGPGGYSAMVNHGGITAIVITEGQVQLGDTVQPLEVAV